MKKITIAILGGLACLVYILISFLIRDIVYIWVQTRIFGLISFLFLFLTVVIGELRVLAFRKSKFKLFVLHTPIAIFATILVFLHFVSSIADNYKWGTLLTFSQYLGFSFSDKWLVFLSLGTLAFYFMLLVGATSHQKSMQFLKYKNWKIIHYFSYLSFGMAYIHSVNLGTDLKTSPFAIFLKPVIIIMFLIVVALSVTRILKSLKIFNDQIELNSAALFFLIFFIGGAFLLMYAAEKMNAVQILETDIQSSLQNIQVYENDVMQVQKINTEINIAIQRSQENSKNLVDKINEVQNG